MENEILNMNPIPTITEDLEQEQATIHRPMSPIERIVAGSIDGRPIANWNGKMDGLLIALAKTMKLLAKDKLSAGEKRKAYSMLEQITTEDIQKACTDASNKTIKAITSFEDVSQTKVKAPVIAPNANDMINPQASKDFSSRIGNGYFASNSKHTVKMKDLLSANVDKANMLHVNIGFW